MDFNSSKNITFLDSEFRYKLFPAFYSVVFVLGLLANAYVLYVLWHIREAKAMNEIRIYMTNLTVADLLFVCVLPFWIDYYMRRGNWVHSDALCRLSGSFFFINTYCSVLFLAVISINRYWAVTRPLVAASSDCWKRGACISFAVWAVTLAAAAYQLTSVGLQMDKEKEIERCMEGYHTTKYNEKMIVAVTHFLIVGLFILVFLLVVACNVLIARALLSQPISQPRASTGRRPHGTKRRALRMLCAVVGVFIVCFLPHHLVQVPWVIAVLELVEWDDNTRQVLNDAHQVTLLLMGLNCILDPIVYCFATRKFRKYIQSHLNRVRQSKNCSNYTTTTNMSMKTRNQNEMISVFEEPKE
ncbi:platelet-activating factor receptor [Electrophorus electricus]|uniref:Platelet-activating factor receptor n=1 Tax=Electrophorus electricus TaxID=8005 RepID=A0A4W4EMB3_ELEEL|nr:platelet-activating factor receptor [Electrophorus electricus]XP_026888778.2 platelet-activating factor receptor [Electrophorus electricus]